MRARPAQTEPAVRTLSDDELMLLCRDGTPEAFDMLFERYNRSVYGFARSMLGASGDAAEVLQDTFLAALAAAHCYTSQGKFKAWLMQIARNRCLNRLQARRAREAIMRGTGFRLVETVAADPDPAECAAADDREQVVRQAVSQLPDRQREAIALYAFEQMSYQDIAAVMEAPVNTVKTLIRRARIALAQALADVRQEL